MKRMSLAFSILIVFVLICIAAVIVLLPSPQAAITAAQVQTVYRITDSFIQQLDPKAPQLNQLFADAKNAGANSLLWDAPIQDKKMFGEVAKQTAKQNLGFVVALDMQIEQKEKDALVKKYPISGICGVDHSNKGLKIYPPQTEGLQQIVLPDESGAEFYSLWAQATPMIPVAAGTDGQNHIALCQQLQNPPAIPQTALTENAALSIGLPSPDQKTTAEQHFVAGTADPALPLLVNGQPVEVQNGGFWGVFVPLQEGENTITATQEGQTSSLIITRTKPKEGSWIPTNPTPDGSEALEAGQFIQITSPLASLLSDYEEDGSILQTVYQGAVAQVEESIEFTRGKKQTHAYRVQDGWILAKDCQPLKEYSTQQLTAVNVRQEGRNSIFRLEGGTPLVTAERTENSLTLFLSGAVLNGSVWQETGMAQAITFEQKENGLLLRFEFPQNALWGWSVDYAENAAEIILKAPPELSQNPVTPLEGITILLDAGHGLDDLGALGPMGAEGPTEKDLNLGAALATKQRLEQLGATVLMSREEDVFPTLVERNQQLRQEKPDLFLALHHNSIPLTKDVNEIHGVECYYFYPSGKLLAQNLADTVSRFLERQNRGEKYNYFYVTRSDICPAVLLEIGFTPNPEEYSNCASAEGIAKTAYAISQAVENTLQGKTPPTDEK